MIKSEYNQEMPQSEITVQHMTPRERDIRTMTNRHKNEPWHEISNNLAF